MIYWKVFADGVEFDVIAAASAADAIAWTARAY